MVPHNIMSKHGNGRRGSEGGGAAPWLHCASPPGDIGVILTMSRPLVLPLTLTMFGIKHAELALFEWVTPMLIS